MDVTDRLLNENDVAALQELLESQPEYAEQVTGYPPGPSDALSALIGVPPDLDPAHKRALGLWAGDALVAFADVLVGHPDPRTASLGLLVVHRRHQRRGLGHRLHRSVEALLIREAGPVRLRVGVISTTAGASEPFWVALGYQPTDEVKPYRYAGVVGTVRIWERRAGDPAADE